MQIFPAGVNVLPPFGRPALASDQWFGASLASAAAIAIVSARQQQMSATAQS